MGVSLRMAGLELFEFSKVNMNGDHLGIQDTY